ncbi:RlpA-like double-psi beta-barrel-protein domain-containing protein-containing protein [Fomitopsis serialis]|uniref:RlpA-like double-psi beta-barrel-protein domain-containing protein-containing protein n=1 Tax=Fomitopsis serialis TaxID=139415 RepID=UPI002007796B|nr:RlpA-like double-psi beta-barrel-protein domain-containing protein-containing protein [Neoantrodia serialis]KAH9920946.1 RlpA-like double-psi beta-barrel-protein domain-containing protein-containing protein [Neoantrodia serialis]
MQWMYLLAAAGLVAVGPIGASGANGYYQEPSASASFTQYSGCGSPACGIPATGYTAAMNQLSFGSAPGSGPGDACGRCFQLTGSADPYSPDYSGPFNSIVVKVTDLCPASGNEVWCGQTTSDSENQYGMPVQCLRVGAQTGELGRKTLR